METITRYAPSPTGNPHIGNIRTALFSYLYAKSKKGKFLLRIEDTDRARFDPRGVKYIEDSLQWLGISYDGEKVFQSDRVKNYQKYADVLLRKGKAYKCFCSQERLRKLREDQIERRQAPGYDGKCANLSAAQQRKHEEAGSSHVIRFRMPDNGRAGWEDLVRGRIEIDFRTQEDPIILKTDGWPTYHLACVIDDHEMKVTDVIRGEEWIPSTPKHLALYESFGWKVPRFAHLPVILGSDKGKLSKRHGDTAILDFRTRGYLPEAMVNFMALLGWNPGTEKEIFSYEELKKQFSINRVGKAPAVFDVEKLNWMNGQYIRRMKTTDLAKTIKGLYPNSKIVSALNFDRILEIEKNRLTTLADIGEGNDYFLRAPGDYSRILVFKKSTVTQTKKGLAAAASSIAKITEKDWQKMTIEGFEAVLKSAVDKEGLSNGDLFWPVRVALSGLEKSPSPAELLWAMGKEESEKRIKAAMDLL